MNRQAEINLFSVFLIVLAIGLVGVAVAYPQIWHGVTGGGGGGEDGPPPLCVDEPFVSTCLCGEGEEKITKAGTLTQYLCEAEEKELDPEDPDVEAKAVEIAEAYLLEHYPDCNMNDCSDPADASAWVVGLGYLDEGFLAFTNPVYDRRIYNVRCVGSTIPPKEYVNLDVDVVSGQVNTIEYCFSAVMPEEEEVDPQKPNAKLEIDVPAMWRESGMDATWVVDDGFRELWSFSSDCRIDNGYDEVTVYPKVPNYPVEKWMVSSWPPGLCEILEETPEYARIRCGAPCGARGTLDDQLVTVEGMGSRSYLDSLCDLSIITPYSQACYDKGSSILGTCDDPYASFYMPIGQVAGCKIEAPATDSPSLSGYVLWKCIGDEEWEQAGVAGSIKVKFCPPGSEEVGDAICWGPGDYYYSREFRFMNKQYFEGSSYPGFPDVVCQDGGWSWSVGDDVPNYFLSSPAAVEFGDFLCYLNPERYPYDDGRSQYLKGPSGNLPASGCPWCSPDMTQYWSRTEGVYKNCPVPGAWG